MKTQEPRVVQGIKDPGPSNGKRLNPLAALGISPVGTVKGVQKTFVTALYWILYTRVIYLFKFNLRN